MSNFAENMAHSFGRFFVETKKPLPDVIAGLERAGSSVTARMDAATDSSYRRRVVSHIIGIERWGQRRLRVFLGEAPLDDEYDGYRPAPDTDWASLKAQFAETRAETVRLAREIERANVPLTQAAAHNGYGMLTPRGWLTYLRIHADLESQRLRR
jgi:hypothetical protein